MHTDRRRKILFVVDDAAFFKSHQLRLAHEAITRGFEPVVACGAASEAQTLREIGFRTRSFELSLAGWNPLRDLSTILSLLRLYREEAPDLVHHLTTKPVIYGSLASRFARVPAVVNSISGNGLLFNQRGFVVRGIRGFVNLLYRIASSRGNMRFIFQNREDLQRFLAHTAISERLTHLIRGSGINLRELPFTPEPPGPVTFLLIAHMLGDKGIRAFVTAARNVHQLQPEWRFQVVGSMDPRNHSPLANTELEPGTAEGIVEWLGARADVAQILKQSHVVCLASYPEGLPKSLLEACAIGRPMIAGNEPGCGDIVRDGITGVRVQSGDSQALVEAMLRLGQDPTLRVRMGKAAHDRAGALYSIEDVVHDTFLIYEELLRG